MSQTPDNNGGVKSEFNTKLQEHLTNRDRDSLLKHLGKHENTLFDDGNKSPVLMKVVGDLLGTTSSTDPQTLSEDLETILMAARQVVKYDPDHLQRQDGEGKDTFGKLLCLATHNTSTNDRPNVHMAHPILGYPILGLIMDLYDVFQHPQAAILPRSQVDGDPNYFAPLVRFVELALPADDYKPSASFVYKVCCFLRGLQPLQQAFLQAAPHTPLHAVCQHWCSPSRKNRWKLGDYMAWLQLTETVFECCPQAAQVKGSSFHKDPPILAAIQYCTKKQSSPAAAQLPLATARPETFLIQDDVKDFRVNRGDYCPLRDFPTWQLDAYIQVYDHNHALPDDHPGKVWNDGNALHGFFHKTAGDSDMVPWKKALFNALPPNHPMVTEWNDAGVAPLHVLLRRRNNVWRNHMIAFVVDRHPVAVQRRTRSNLHPLQILINGWEKSKKKESTELLWMIYTMIRADPGHTMDNMKGDAGPVAGPPSRRGKKKTGKRKRY